MPAPKITELFSQKTIKRLSGKTSLTGKQTSAASKWLGLLDNNKLQDEGKNHPKFTKLVLSDLLGYDVEDLRFEGSRAAFSWGPHDKRTLCIEVKGTTPDLFALQCRKGEHSTPIRQFWDYMGGIEGLNYGICTNYRHFVLFAKWLGPSKHHTFDFTSVKNDPEKLKEFVGVFSKRRIEAGFVEKLRLESQVEENDLIEEFYSLYSQTRLMLIKEFQSTGDIDTKDAVGFAQTFLNRLIFVFFAEDCRLIDRKDTFSTNVTQIIRGQLGKTTQRVWKYLVDTLFVHFEKGSDDHAISELNGGLFQNHFPAEIHIKDKRENGFFKEAQLRAQIPEAASWEFKRDTESAVSGQKNLNPIIQNLLKLSSYDFESQIRVNTLGHIFENSLSELEGLLRHDQEISQNDSQRKREGVFYTPEPIAQYICRNAIIPYLSKSGTGDVYALLDEHADDISILEQKLRDIKILDPACGSGAFLIEAANTLIEIHEIIQQHKSLNGNFEKNTPESHADGAKIRSVVKNNLYGIDLNSQSVEITKLSMFLMTASRNEELQNLSENIIAGNSVIHDANFNRNEAFPKLGGFDIIIGNPPYVRQEDIEDKDRMQLPPSPQLALPDGFEIPKTSDLSSYFYYHSLLYLRPGGKLGFITSDSWLHWNYGKPLRKFLLDNCTLDILMRTDFNVFSDANVKTVTTILTKKEPKHRPPPNAVKIINVHDRHFGKLSERAKPHKDFENLNLRFNDNWTLHFVDPMPEPKIPMIPMSDAGAVRMGRKTGNNNFFVMDKQTINKYHIGKKHYRPIIPDTVDGIVLDNALAREYLLYAHESKGDLARSAQGKNVLRYIKEGDVSAIPKRGKSKQTRLVSELSSVKGHKPHWYSLKLPEPAPILLSLFANERPKIYENTKRYHVLNNYAEFTPHVERHIPAYLAFFSSSWFALLLEKFGHIAGGNALQIKTGDYLSSHVPDFLRLDLEAKKSPRAPNSPMGHASASAIMSSAWKEYREDPDQRKLDRVVLGTMGFTAAEIRAIRDDLSRSVHRRLNS